MEYNIYNIYTNLERFIATREWSKCSDLLNKDEFDVQMRANGYTTITGYDRNEQLSSIVLTNNVSNIANHTKEFTSMSKSVKGVIILISNKEITSLVKKYASLKNRIVYSYTFSKFIIDMTKAPLVPKHRLLPKDEAEHILNNVLYKEPRNLPSISILDTQVIWLGANFGDIIEITRLSESTGLSLAYRHVCL